MRSLIRELVQVTGVFFPLVVLCVALSSQLMRSPLRKPFVPQNKETISATSADLAKLNKRRDTTPFLMFEQITR